MTTSRARDIRFGGTWSPAQRAKNDALYAAATLVLGAARRLSLPARIRLGRALGALAWLSPTLRARAGLHARGALGDAAPTSLACWLAMGELAARWVEGLRPLPSRQLELAEPSRDALRGALARGRGVVYATAHLGPWEAMGPLLVAEGFPIVTLTRESYDPRFDALYRSLRDAHGVVTIARGAPGAPKAILRALRGGKVLGFPMDLVGRGVRTVDATWFERPVPTPVGPAELALRTGASVVVGTPAAGGELLIRAIDTDGHDASSLTQALATELAARIRATPTAYPWLARAL